MNAPAIGDVGGTMEAAAAAAWARCRGVAVDAPGDPRLRPYQRGGAEALARMLRAWGGALLADQVGAGKTFTAIDAARRMGGRATVVCPSPLVGAWRRSLTELGCDWSVVSDGVLSRRDVADEAGGVVIVDEAHRFRNRHTRRRATLERLIGARPVLLVTATPVWSRPEDMVALLELAVSDRAFVTVTGRRACALADVVAAHVGAREALEEAFMVRRTGLRPGAVRTEEVARPEVAPPEVIRVVDEGARAAMALGGDPAELFVGVVRRRLASSPEAAARTLDRARRFLERAEDAARVGRHLDRAEWGRAFLLDGDAEQLVMPFWYEEGGAGVSVDVLRAGRLRTERALDALAPVRTRGSAKLRVLERFVDREGRVLCFTEYAVTAFAIVDAVRPEWHALAVTGAVCRWVGIGRMGRDQALELAGRPERGGAAAPRLIVLTPVGSEGLDLQHAAAAVAHYDQPWTHGRMEQRVGRLDRLGGPERIAILTLLPSWPGSAGFPAGGTEAPPRRIAGAESEADVASGGACGDVMPALGGRPPAYALGTTPAAGYPEPASSRAGRDPGAPPGPAAFVRVDRERVAALAVVGRPEESWARCRADGEWRAVPIGAVLRGGGWRGATPEVEWQAALAEVVAANELAAVVAADVAAVGRARDLEAAGRDVLRSAGAWTGAGTRGGRGEVVGGGAGSVRGAGPVDEPVAWFVAEVSRETGRAVPGSVPDR